MTKTLTEQWREGKLSLNYYYIKLQSGKYGIDHTVMSIDGDLPKTKFAYSNFAIEEVLAPVPTYDEYKRLEKRLEIATKALKEYDNKLNWDIRGVSFMKYNKGFTIARKALKEMEGVK